MDASPVKRRVLGALRCVDATMLMPIDEPLSVSAPGARLLRNRSGLYVIQSWTRLATHEDVFEAPPAAPAVGSESLVLDVRDLSGRYLSRRVAIALPRDPTPANLGLAGSLFRPVDVPMYLARWPGEAPWCNDTAHAAAPFAPGELRLFLGSARPLAAGDCDPVGEALACRRPAPR